MIETIHHIRLPELGSGLRASSKRQHPRAISPRIFTEFSVTRDGVLHSSIKKPQSTLFVRWRSDATTGRLTAHWESGEEPGPRSHHVPPHAAMRIQFAL